MKHIKEFYEFDKVNEGLMTTISLFIFGYFLIKFIKSIVKDKNYNKNKLTIINRLLYILKRIDKVPVVNLSDRFFIRLDDGQGHVYDLRIFKNESILKVDNIQLGELEIPLNKTQYDEFLSLMKK